MLKHRNNEINEILKYSLLVMVKIINHDTLNLDKSNLSKRDWNVNNMCNDYIDINQCSRYLCFILPLF